MLVVKCAKKLLCSVVEIQKEVYDANEFVRLNKTGRTRRIGKRGIFCWKENRATRASVDDLCIETTLNAYFMEKLFKKNFDDIQNQLKDIYRTSWIQSEMCTACRNNAFCWISY